MGNKYIALEGCSTVDFHEIPKKNKRIIRRVGTHIFLEIKANGGKRAKKIEKCKLKKKNTAGQLWWALTFPETTYLMDHDDKGHRLTTLRPPMPKTRDRETFKMEMHDWHALWLKTCNALTVE